MKRSRFMDFCARIWIWIGEQFQVRPAMLIGMMVGALAFTAALTYVLVEQNSTERQVNEIREAFCNSQEPNPIQCRNLFDALRKNPTPAQARRLKEIVGD